MMQFPKPDGTIEIREGVSLSDGRSPTGYILRDCYRIVSRSDAWGLLPCSLATAEVLAEGSVSCADFETCISDLLSCK